jgi:hypothetical protein
MISEYERSQRDRPYRVIVAEPGDDPDFASGETLISFPGARQRMLGLLAFLLDDECSDCRERGTRAFVDLALARPGFWQAEVDGVDYRIVVAPHTP